MCVAGRSPISSSIRFGSRCGSRLMCFHCWCTHAPANASKIFPKPLPVMCRFLIRGDSRLSSRRPVPSSNLKLNSAGSKVDESSASAGRLGRLALPIATSQAPELHLLLLASAIPLGSSSAFSGWLENKSSRLRSSSLIQVITPSQDEP